MTQLSELASRILAHLEEAHAENISSTINTVESVLETSKKFRMRNRLCFS
jgi:hypothetical protein